MYTPSIAAEFKGADIGYRRPVVRGVSFSIPARGLIALIGPNGAGKTTIMRSLFGRARVFKGIVKAYVELSYIPAELPEGLMLTALEVVLTARANGGWASASRALEALKALNIADLANVRMSELSTGQKRLVMLARALASGAPLLLVDEPTANLDLGNRMLVARLLAELSRSRAVVVATHDLYLVRQAQRVIVVNGGSAIDIGPPANLTWDILAKAYSIPYSGREFNDLAMFIT